MPTTKQVVEQHLKCFGEHDLDGVLADHAPDGVLFVPGEPLRGRDAMKALFQALIAEFAKQTF